MQTGSNRQDTANILSVLFFSDKNIPSVDGELRVSGHFQHPDNLRKIVVTFDIPGKDHSPLRTVDKMDFHVIPAGNDPHHFFQGLLIENKIAVFPSRIQIGIYLFFWSTAPLRPIKLAPLASD